MRSCIPLKSSRKAKIRWNRPIYRERNGIERTIDSGVLSPGTRGSTHGEVGQTQFMPENIPAYGTGNLDVAANRSRDVPSVEPLPRATCDQEFRCIVGRES